MEKKFELKGPAAIGCGVAVAVVIFGSAMLLAPEHLCPSDYWPHAAQTKPPAPGAPEPCPPMLRTILEKAALAHDAEPVQAKKDLILRCILLTLDCAWQDLTAHTTTQQEHHAEAVRKARDAAIGTSPTKWLDVERLMTPASPIPGETIDHPH